ncbi:MAG: cysteate synthase [archaeon]|nr:cysteate synthase [archaeon]
MSGYDLICVENGEKVEERYTLSCPNGHNSLLRAEYHSKQLNPQDYDNIFKYSDWLPVKTVFESKAKPVCFRSEKLSKELGLSDLWVGFTGYYPERNAHAVSGSFKELEALPTYSRLHDYSDDTIVIASAGNTARAFAEIGNQIGKNCVIVVPEKAEDRITVSNDRGFAKLLSVKGDYADAIAVADRIAAKDGYVPEGGAKNIARRDGMGTVMLEGALTIGHIPDRYFQGVGSGTGGISAWEAAVRLMDDGRFGDRLPVLELSQNEPFLPMAKAWNAGRRNIVPEDLGEDPATDVAAVYADVLTNRKPPYGIAGGVYDAMVACNGRFHTASNTEAKDAEKLWMSIENVRPDPAASVALATLIKAVDEGKVGKDDCILLNMTGGGRERAKEELSLQTVKPVARLCTDVSDEDLAEVL